MTKITFREFVRFAYVFGLATLIASLCFSKIAISISQFILTGAWVLERFDTARMKRFFNSHSSAAIVLRLIPTGLLVLFQGILKGFRDFLRNKPALVFSSIMILHVAGLIFTVDFNYALKDLRTKLPLILLPLFLSTSEPFGRKGFARYMMLFFLAVLVASLINTWKIINYHYVDIREVARHISHIVFSLIIILSVFSMAWFILKKNARPWWMKILLALVLCWLVVYLVVSRSATGMAIGLVLLVILLLIMIFRQRRRWLQLVMGITVIAVLLGTFLYLRQILSDYYHVNPVDVASLEPVSPKGNLYIHNLENSQTENGNYLWIYIQWDEMRDAWNRRSEIAFDSLDLKGQPVTYTVVRFLTSKGYRKDAAGVEKLTREEVSAIEKGVANHLFMKGLSFRGRIYEFLAGYEKYRQTGDPTGSTIMQRVEFWKASLGLIREYWLTGVGTGDMNLAFGRQYEKMNSKLAPEHRWRSHNQFLSIFIGFGVFGLAWFLLALFYPPIAMRRLDDYFFLVFMLIAMMSMLTEDTIESQTGVSFFAFFYSFFLFARKEKDPLP
jgi:hypothetical protein